MSRESFIDGLKVEEPMALGKPISVAIVEIDTYRKYISEALPGFISFMELINSAITTLEDNLVMSNIGFKARIKDTTSSVSNTERKVLDDIFGFELIAPNETDKEILMLLIHKIFDDEICFRTKNHDKSNGYKAHHCVGILKKEIDGNEFDDIEKYILKAKDKIVKKKYRGLRKEEKDQIPNSELYQKIDLYPNLKKQIEQEGHLDPKTVEILKKISLEIENYYRQTKGERKGVPPIEVQFKTAHVAEEAIYGAAKHDEYKPINREEIANKYKNKQLIRGMNFPFKFYRANGEMKLQPADVTLVEMWPFLKETIIQYRNDNPNEASSYNMHMATVFPELKPYVRELAKREPYIRVRSQNVETIWNGLKQKILYPDIREKNNKEKETNKGV